MTTSPSSSINKIAVSSRVFCILGDNRVLHSKAPLMYSKVMEHAGIDGVCVPFEVMQGKIGEALNSLRVLNISGANITIPYKEAVIPYLEQISEGANIVGAINTVIIKNNKLKGYNSNAIGFMHTIEEAGFDPHDKSAIVFGSGGVAMAAVFMLNWLRIKRIYISSANLVKSEEIAKRIAGEVLPIEDLLKRPLPVNIMINASPVSGVEEQPEYAEIISKLDIPECSLIVDFNYGRKRNFYQEKAESDNIKFVNGLTNLSHQARSTLSLWTGVDVPASTFREVLDNIL